MKKIILIFSLFVSLVGYGQQIQSFPQIKRGATPATDSMFAVAVMGTDTISKKWLDPNVPIPFGMIHYVLDSVKANIRFQTDSAKENIRSQMLNIITNNSTETGRNLLNLAAPASPSIVRVNPNGTAVSRTVPEALQDLGLNNIDNTSDLSKPLSTAAINANALKANINSPTFTGTPTGIGIPVYARVTGANATTTGQALVDIAGLSIPLTTNAIYEISGMLSVSTSNVTTGVQYGLNYSVAGGTVEAQLSGSLTSTATKTERISTLNAASTAYLTTSNGTGGIIIRGIITTGANAGNLTVKFLKVTSGTATVFQNSVLKVTRIQ